MRIEINAFDQTIMQPYNIRFRVKQNVTDDVFQHREYEMFEDATGKRHSGVTSHQIAIRNSQGINMPYLIYSQITEDRLVIKGSAIKTKTVCLNKIEDRIKIAKPYNIHIRTVGRGAGDVPVEHKFELLSDKMKAWA